MENETWLNIPGYPGYSVSDAGRLRADYVLTGTHTNPSVITLIANGGIMKQSWHKHGYLHVSMRSIGRVRKIPRLVHRLVMLAFVGPCPAGLEVNHKNGKKDDNRLSNLEYVTGSENVLHSYRILGRRGRVGEVNGRCKITEKMAREIKAALSTAKPRPQTDIARQFGVAYHIVNNINLGLAWAHIS
jgi:hypothetical protein